MRLSRSTCSAPGHGRRELLFSCENRLFKTKLLPCSGLTLLLRPTSGETWRTVALFGGDWEREGPDGDDARVVTPRGRGVASSDPSTTHPATQEEHDGRDHQIDREPVGKTQNGNHGTKDRHADD